MPHKHKRSRKPDDSTFDLPPTTVARPLNVRTEPEQSKTIATKRKRAKSQTKVADDGLFAHDDTPKAFARLMRLQTSRAGSKVSAIDEPTAKRAKHSSDETGRKSKSAEVPTIQPGERLSDFAVRLHHALPISGLVRKANNVAGVKERQTRMEKKLQKMQAQWRIEEARLQEKEAEARELAEEEEDEKALLYDGGASLLHPHRRKSKRTPLVTEDADEDDPWAVLEATRQKPQGLHDVVQAPPQFKSVPKEKFKVRNGAKVAVSDIPNSAGSLRRREELGETRKSIIEGYRRMMEGKHRHS